MSKKAVMIIASNGFRDEEFKVPDPGEEIGKKNIHEILGYCFIWSGVVLVATSGYFFLEYRDDLRDIDNRIDDYRLFADPSDHGRFLELKSSIRNAQSSARTNSIVGYVLAGVGTASVVWGLVELLTLGSRPPSKKVSVVPAFHGNSVGISLHSGF